MLTLQQLTTRVERELSQYAGPGVQLYAQSVLEQRIQQAFNYIFKLEWWPQFIVREVRTLDGTTGLVTADFTLIDQWDDIRFIFRNGSTRPLSEAPLAFTTLGFVGNTAQLVQPRVDAKLFTVYPLGSTGDLEVIGRAKPNDFILTDTVPFDEDAIMHYAAWSYLVDDGSNPASAAKQQGLFDIRMKMLTDAMHQNIVRLNPRSDDIPSRWYER